MFPEVGVGLTTPGYICTIRFFINHFIIIYYFYIYLRFSESLDKILLL